VCYVLVLAGFVVVVAADPHRLGRPVRLLRRRMLRRIVSSDISPASTGRLFIPVPDGLVLLLFARVAPHCRWTTRRAASGPPHGLLVMPPQHRPAQETSHRIYAENKKVTIYVEATQRHRQPNEAPNVGTSFQRPARQRRLPWAWKRLWCGALAITSHVVVSTNARVHRTPSTTKHDSSHTQPS